MLYSLGLKIHFILQSSAPFSATTIPVSSVDPPSTPARRTSGAPSLWPHLAPSRSALQTHPSAARWPAPPWSAPCTSPVGPYSVPAAVWPSGSPWLGSWVRPGLWDPRGALVPSRGSPLGYGAHHRPSPSVHRSR